MAINTQTIRIDLNTGRTIPVAFAHQNDTNRQLTFQLYNNGVAFTPSSTTVKFAYKSPIVNGRYSVITGSQMASGTVSGNTVTVTLPAQYTQVSGVGLLTMILITSGNTLRPVNIKFVCQGSADGDDTVLNASDWPEGLYDYMDNWLEENEPTEIANLKSDLLELQNGGYVADAQRIGEVIDDWLDDHPEATTTVQDNSLTKNKFAASTLEKYVLIPDEYSGNDTQKLQACLDELKETGGVICINRSYTLTANVVCSLDTSTNNHILILGIGQDARINFGVYSFVGTIDDRTGGLWFEGVRLYGSGTAFDCAKLIRLKFNMCYFVGFDKVFESGSENDSQIFQTIYLNQCYMRGIGTAVFYNPRNAVYDVRLSETTMESGGTLFISTGTFWINQFVVENCCLEGIDKIMKTSANERIFQAVFDKNYLELNDEYFDLSECMYIANMSICDNLIADGNEKAFIMLPSSVQASAITGALTVKRNTLADRSARFYLFGFAEIPDKQGYFTAVKMQDNRMDYITYRNQYNKYLPYKVYHENNLEYNANTEDEFALVMADDLINAQPICMEYYSVKWTGRYQYSVLFNKLSDNSAIVVLARTQKVKVFTYNSGAISESNTLVNNNQLESQISNLVPKGTAQNADDAEQTGIYTIGTAIYLVMRLDQNFVSQLRFTYNTNYIEYRSRVTGVWQSWHRLTGTSNV